MGVAALLNNLTSTLNLNTLAVFLHSFNVTVLVLCVSTDLLFYVWHCFPGAWRVAVFGGYSQLRFSPSRRNKLVRLEPSTQYPEDYSAVPSRRAFPPRVAQPPPTTHPRTRKAGCNVKDASHSAVSLSAEPA